MSGVKVGARKRWEARVKAVISQRTVPVWDSPKLKLEKCSRKETLEARWESTPTDGSVGAVKESGSGQ